MLASLFLQLPSYNELTWSSTWYWVSFDLSQAYIICFIATPLMQCLFAGYAAGRHHYRIGGGSNFLCLPEQPQWRNHSTGTTWSGWLYGTVYRLKTGHDALFRNGGSSVFHNKPTPCAVCYVPQRSAQLMIPASNECPIGWTREYNGYLMSAYSYAVQTKTYAHHSASYICIDLSPETAVGPINILQALLYFVKVGCGTLPCSRYHNGWEVACVVCTKWHLYAEAITSCDHSVLHTVVAPEDAKCDY